jgi:hypothetical protein
MITDRAGTLFAKIKYIAINILTKTHKIMLLQNYLNIYGIEKSIKIFKIRLWDKVIYKMNIIISD